MSKKICASALPPSGFKRSRALAAMPTLVFLIVASVLAFALFSTTNFCAGADVPMPTLPASVILTKSAPAEEDWSVTAKY